MYLFDLQAKLKEVDPNLYVKTDHRIEATPGVFSSGIYLKANRRKANAISRSDVGLAGKDVMTRLLDSYTGQLDVYLGGVTLDWIPEYDEFHCESGRLIRKGWRSVALSLVKQGVCSLDKVRKVFGSSLGEASYDKLTYEQKLYKARQEMPNAVK